MLAWFLLAAMPAVTIMFIWGALASAGNDELRINMGSGVRSRIAWRPVTHRGNPPAPTAAPALRWPPRLVHVADRRVLIARVVAADYFGLVYITALIFAVSIVSVVRHDAHTVPGAAITVAIVGELALLAAILTR